jgi:hypothetical protein
MPRYTGPPLLNDRIAAALSDPRRLELDDEIALVTSRLQEEVAAVGVVDPVAVAEQVDALVAALKNGEPDAIRSAVNALAALRLDVNRDQRIWDRIIRLARRRAQLVESQRRREAELQMLLPKAQVIEWANALLEACTRHVRDRDTLTAISADIAALVGRTPTVH